MSVVELYARYRAQISEKIILRKMFDVHPIYIELKRKSFSSIAVKGRFPCISNCQIVLIWRGPKRSMVDVCSIESFRSFFALEKTSNRHFGQSILLPNQCFLACSFLFFNYKMDSKINVKKKCL